nr:MAG TPA: hypothetical protein [Caudoviricetes sp.]DAF07297.1 MAG TPA: hypothetical protein [Caudoviricetes sp.]
MLYFYLGHLQFTCFICLRYRWRVCLWKQQALFYFALRIMWR